MKITNLTVTVRELTENYIDDIDKGVYGYNNRLTIRPPYQREFVYKDKQRNAVIDTVFKGFPLGLMYWSLNSDGTYECLDGQQRTISICQYVNDEFPIKISGNDKFCHNLTDEEKEALLAYKLEIRVCDGSESEKLEWFKIINIAGETLTNQELLNATYTGTWLADAKTYFSKRNCVVANFANGYIKGNPIRQDYLEKALSWVADRDILSNGQMYMAIHQHDADANDLFVYFQNVINWAKQYFPTVRKGITDSVEWGLLYNKYNGKVYNAKTLETEMISLIEDDDVTKKQGIVPYLLSDRTYFDEKHLSIRTFTDTQKRKAYEKQKGTCPICGLHYELEEMQGDHIVPWSKGGRTTDENLQMLCCKCNNLKKND